MIKSLLILIGIEQICTGCPAHSLITLPTELLYLLLFLPQFYVILANNISLVLILVFRILQNLPERKLQNLVDLIP